MIVILNRGAGHHQDETQAQIKKFFQKRGIAARLFVIPDSSILGIKHRLVEKPFR
jgi:hypothetical protein